MKILSLIKYFLFLSIAIGICACSQDIINIEPEFSQIPSEEDTCIYPLVMDSNVLAYDSESRASDSWKDGDNIYLKLQISGKIGAIGTATYSDGSWLLTLNNALTDNMDDVAIGVYIDNGNPTSYGVTMNDKSAFYLGQGKYSFTNGKVYLSMTLSPNTWRMRFKGAPSQTITLKADKNDILYYKLFNPQTFFVTNSVDDISLTVNADGYTPYIYGVFINTDGDNKITVHPDNDDSYYTRSINGSELTAGMSGVYILPSESDLYGWTKEDINPYLTFTYPNDLGLTVDDIKNRYGNPQYEFGEYKMLYYIPSENKDLIENVVYVYNDKKVVYDIVLVLKNNDDRIPKAFDKLYFRYVKDDIQYIWLNNPINPTMEVYYVTSQLAIEYVMVDEVWKSIGKTDYTDPFFAGGIFPDIAETSFPVDVQVDNNPFGMCRLVSPYKDTCPYLNIQEDHYILINSLAPDYVYIPRQPLGFKLEDKMIYVSDLVGAYLYWGYTLDAVKDEFPDYFGKKVGSTITFAEKSLILWIGEDAYYANLNGAFSIYIPVNEYSASLAKESSKIKILSPIGVPQFVDHNLIRRRIAQISNHQFPQPHKGKITMPTEALNLNWLK